MFVLNAATHICNNKVFKQKVKDLWYIYSTLSMPEYICIFFLSFWRTDMFFFGSAGTPVFDFWWRLLWVSKPEWVLHYSHCGGKCNVHFLRSTSGATHADLLVADLPPVLSLHTVAEVRLPGFELMLSEYLWVRRSTNWAKPGRASMPEYLSTSQKRGCLC